MRQPYQFARPDGTPEGFTFVQRGEEVHTGLELNAAGRVTDNLRLTASVNLIQARASIPARRATRAIRSSTCRVLRTALSGLPPAVRAGAGPARRLALCQQQRGHAGRRDAGAGVQRVRCRPALRQRLEPATR